MWGIEYGVIWFIVLCVIVLAILIVGWLWERRGL